MTIEQYFTDRLISNGMFPRQAAAVMELVKADESTEAMAGRWNHPADDYPKTILAVLWMTICDKAVEWIDANIPLAWFRPMFAR